MGVQVLHLPTLDFTGTPSQKHIHQAVKFIIDARTGKESVYIHCKAGRTRSVTVTACYLIYVSTVSVVFSSFDLI